MLRNLGSHSRCAMTKKLLSSTIEKMFSSLQWMKVYFTSYICPFLSYTITTDNNFYDYDLRRNTGLFI